MDWPLSITVLRTLYTCMVQQWLWLNFVIAKCSWIIHFPKHNKISLHFVGCALSDSPGSRSLGKHHGAEHRLCTENRGVWSSGQGTGAHWRTGDVMWVSCSLQCWLYFTVLRQLTLVSVHVHAGSVRGTITYYILLNVIIGVHVL